MIYTIKNDKTEVKINSLGAEVRSVIHNGRERAWQNETGEWLGCAILLFPFAGFNRLVYDRVDFGYNRHGFYRVKNTAKGAYKRLFLFLSHPPLNSNKIRKQERVKET